MKRFTSNARWPKQAGFAETTTDFHDTKEQADAVCRMLTRNGFGGEGKVFPLRTWVEETQEATR